MQKIKATTLSPESIDKFRSWLSVKAKSVHTVKGYCSDLQVFLQETGETEVSMEEFEELGMAWLTKNRRILAPRTSARRLTSLREFAKWSGHPELIKDYAAPGAGPGMPHPLPEGMEGVRRMLAVAANERQRALVTLLGMAGLRMHEALSAQSEWFIFKGQNGRDPWIRVLGKGETVRLVPLTEEAFGNLVQPIARVMGTQSPVIPLQDRFARRAITELGQRAGLQRRVASHDLRATFATALYNKTKDQRLVQRLLGHASGQTTEVYIGTSDKQMIDGVNGL